jgi:hypothetical protein
MNPGLTRPGVGGKMKKWTFLVTLAVASLVALAEPPPQDNSDANKRSANQGHATGTSLIQEQSLKVIAALKAKESQTTNITQKKSPAQLSGMGQSPPLPRPKPLTQAQAIGLKPPLPIGGTVHHYWPPPPPPKFSVVTPAALYKGGDPILLTLTMERADSGTYYDFSICTFAPSVISVVYVRRDGKAVAPSYTIADFPDDPFYLQSMSYVKVSDAGVEIPFPLGKSATGNPQILIGGTRGAYSLAVKSPVTNIQKIINVPAHRTTTYELNKPGFYTIQLRYQDGPLLVDSNELVFAIQ